MTTKKAKPNIYLEICPSRELLVRVADKWAVMVILALEQESIRFGGLKRKLEGVSQKMLTQTLKNLERDGLITRTVFSGRPLRVDYSLTPRGKDLIAALRPMVTWAEANIVKITAHRLRYDAQQSTSE
jgi:DNA-binding HxlR family transcriptional regulator